MYGSFQNHLKNELNEIENAGLSKGERLITGPQSAHIAVTTGQNVINMCANNYLGLSNHPVVIEAAKKSYEHWGHGLSSVRFICGTQTLHKTLEKRLADFLEMEDVILYSSCFDANGGLFETLMQSEDAIISDELNHASIIDGIRLSKAHRYRYKNNDMQDLEQQLIMADQAGHRFKMIVTDGVFSMDGYIANLSAICDLADQYQALVMVDDSHAVGFMGDKGKGTHEFCKVMGRVDIITGTLGKALGGASGGYTAARKEIVSYLRQRSRPYLFSNTLAPAITAATIAVLDLLEGPNDLIIRLKENTQFFRSQMKHHGFNILPGTHPIVPIMIGDAKVATQMSERLLQKGIYVVGFSYPVVPKEKARIRVQISAGHSRKDLEFAIEKFVEVREEMKV